MNVLSRKCVRILPEHGSVDVHLAGREYECRSRGGQSRSAPLVQTPHLNLTLGDPSYEPASFGRHADHHPSGSCPTWSVCSWVSRPCTSVTLPPVSRQSPASLPWASCCASRPTSPAVRLQRSNTDKNLRSLFEPASQVHLGVRALLCRRGETARARNCGKTSLSYRPCRSLGHGRPKHCAPRVWQWTRAAPCAAGPSARSELPIYAKRLGKLAWAQR